MRNLRKLKNIVLSYNMVNYICEKCDKIFSKKSDYQRHCDRKYPCSKSSGYRCKHCKKIFLNKNDYTRHMKRKIPCNKQIGSKQNASHVCPLCGKGFSLYMGLYNHIKSSVCAKNKKDVSIDKALQSNVINNNSVQNNVDVDGDVKVVKFGNENLSYMTDDVFKQILGRGLRSVQEFIEHSNFHPDHPENHNIYIANIRDEYIVLFDGFKWSITDQDEKMEDIIYAKSDYLEVKFSELKDKMDPRDVLKFENFMKRRDDDDVMRKIKRELKMQFYNNRYLPQRQRRKMELLETQAIRESVQKIKKNKNKKEIIRDINILLSGFSGDDFDEVKAVLSNL